MSSLQEGDYSLGKYKILSKLGEGAFATVYKAQNTETNDFVALKRMKKMTKRDALMVRKQINIMKELNHKNIVRYIEDFRYKGQWIIVLEYCGKGDMERFKQKIGKIPEHYCKIFVYSLLEALKELHKKKIAHRDLKLANILINDEYRIKLADFGFSKDYEAGYMKTFCGSYFTMAPQVLMGQQYDEKCDVWSLGVITYIMLYNKFAFLPEKQQKDPKIAMTNAVLKSHIFLNNVPVSDAGKKFINACLKKNMKDRPTTAQLLDHQWFKGLTEYGLVTQLRVNYFRESLNERQEDIKNKGINLCEMMIGGVFDDHLKKLQQSMHLRLDTIQRTFEVYQKYYKEEDILDYYFMMIVDKLKVLEERKVIYNLYGENIQVKVKNKDIKITTKIIQDILDFLKKLRPNFDPKQSTTKNVERQLIKFCVSETHHLMESSQEEQIDEKLCLLKNWTKFAMTNFEDTGIQIIWGERQDLEKYQQLINQFLTRLKEEDAVRIINKQCQSDEDLEATWLIEHQIKESQSNRKRKNVQVARLALYVLNIPSNFSADKTVIQTDQVMLDEQDN